MMKNVAVTHCEINFDAKFLKYAFLFDIHFSVTVVGCTLGADLTKKDSTST